MSYISDIEWEGTLTFEEIDTWFCHPMKEFLEMFDEQFGQNLHGPEDPRAVFFYYEMKNKLNDLSKLLYRLMDDYDKNPIPAKPEPLSDELKERQIKKFATMMGVNPAHVKHGRRYSVDDLQFIADAFKCLHKPESKDTGSAESAENQRSHVAEQ